MRHLFIVSTGDHSGRTILSWAIAERLTGIGLRIGFMKPFGTRSVKTNGELVDPDVLLFKELLGLEDPVESLCPYPGHEKEAGGLQDPEIGKSLVSMAHELSEGKDILLIMGSASIFFEDASFFVNEVSLIQELGANVVLVHRHRKTSTTLYSILLVASMIKESLLGVVLNRVAPEEMQSARDLAASTLKRGVVSLLAALPEDPRLSFPSLADMKNILNGRVLTGVDRLNQPVGGMTVGAGDLVEDLRLFKRVYNKIVLLKPESPAHPGDPRAIAGMILTVDREPGDHVLRTAENSGIPLILVKGDTFEVLERLEKGYPPLTVNDRGKVRLFIDMMDREAVLDDIVRALDL